MDQYVSLSFGRRTRSYRARKHSCARGPGDPNPRKHNGPWLYPKEEEEEKQARTEALMDLLELRRVAYHRAQLHVHLRQNSATARAHIGPRLSSTSAPDSRPHRPQTHVHIDPRLTSTSTPDSRRHRPQTHVDIGPRLASTSALGLASTLEPTSALRLTSTLARPLAPHRLQESPRQS